MKTTLLISFVILASGCAHKSTSAEARDRIESKWEDRVGKATKIDLIEDFGTPEWCRRDDAGEESCRFYRRKGMKWIGESKHERSYYSTYDEILVDFDGSGKLKSFKANAQR